MANSTEAFTCGSRSVMVLACRGEGYWNAFRPLSSGRITPPVSPKQWNVGSGLNITHSGFRWMWVEIWRALATRFLWLSTTPLGAPKLPEVNRTTPGASGSVFTRNRLGAAPAARP